MSKKTPYSSNFKLKVSLKFLSNSNTAKEVCQEYGISKSTLHKWVSQLKNSSRLIYESDKKSSVLSSSISEKELFSLHAKIGELLLERDYLKKILDA